MPRYEYEIHETGDGAEHAWDLTLNGRSLAHFCKLETALASARSLHHIDSRSGAHPTVVVATAYGKFRVNWLEGATDSVQLDRMTDRSVRPLQSAARSRSQRR